MALVTEVEVAEIIDIDSSTVTDAFINIAHQLVVSKVPTTVTYSLRKEIERLLSAHFIEIKQGAIKSHKIGDASTEYRGKDGYMLDATLWGQSAKALEPKNRLSNIGKPTAKIQAIFTNPADYKDFEDLEGF